ncbi:MAG: response regulator [Candidatus Omnitrophica bacterium]|nr:response regulator [Candidatus Omnitrophota bacterium]
MAKRVLVIDDDSDYVEAVSMLLEAKGYEVISATDGKTGFIKAKEETPGLIILDVMMATRTEGFDVARLLKDDPKTKDIPVILITGIKRDMNLAFGFEPDEVWLPVKAVLDKPVKPEALLKAVEEHIRLS